VRLLLLQSILDFVATPCAGTIYVEVLIRLIATVHIGDVLTMAAFIFRLHNNFDIYFMQLVRVSSLGTVLSCVLRRYVNWVKAFLNLL